MSNPTSNYGWQMPTATDLVTDLPADFEVFGQAVDTALMDLKGGTTGQVLKKNSGTDMDFVWGAVAGDIEGVTAGVGITGGGTSGTVTVTNDMATTITAAGDIVVGTGSGTYDNLPIGTTAQVLTADTTVSPYKVKWATPAGAPADNWALISGQSVSAVSSVSFTSLTGYKKLFFTCPNWFANTTGIQVYFRLNADSAANYVTGTIARSSDGKRNQSGAANEIIANFYAGTQSGMDRTAIGLFIDGCNGGGYKPYTFTACGNTASVQSAFFGSGIYKSTTNISSIDITLASGTITSSSGDGNEFQLWGVA